MGNKSLAEVSEYTLRVVPAVISLIIIILFIIISSQRGKEYIHIIYLLLIISPVFVFYSRYYIQESLFVTFTYSAIISLYKYFSSKQTRWIILSSIFTGLILSTKETSIITISSVVMSLILLLLMYQDFKKKIRPIKVDVILFLVITFSIPILFYSSFFQNPKGIFDSILTYSGYFNKAANNADHIQSWYYYFSLMLLSKTDLIQFTQIPLFIFTLIGVYFSFLKKDNLTKHYFIKFITLFSFIQALVYSSIPYKTPWLLLNFWIGFIIVAGFGIYQFYKLINNKFYKAPFLLFIILLFAHNIYQTYTTSFKYSYQHENPFTYSQPTPDIISLADKIINIAETNPDGKNTLINVIVEGHDYWPLPWYLRKMNNVAWNIQVPNSVYKFPIILSTPQFEDEIIEILYNSPPPGEKKLYIPLFDIPMTLRPNMEIRGFIQHKLNEHYLRSLTETQN